MQRNKRAVEASKKSDGSTVKKITLKERNRWDKGVDGFDRASQQPDYVKRQETLIKALEYYIVSLELMYARGREQVLEEIYANHLLNVLKLLDKQGTNFSPAQLKKYTSTKIALLDKLLKLISQEQRLLKKGEQKLFDKLKKQIQISESLLRDEKQEDNTTSTPLTITDSVAPVACATHSTPASSSTVIIVQQMNVVLDNNTRKRRAPEKNIPKKNQLVFDFELESASQERPEGYLPPSYHYRNMLFTDGFTTKTGEKISPNPPPLRAVIEARKNLFCYETSTNRLLKMTGLYFDNEELQNLSSKEINNCVEKYKINEIKKLQQIEFINFKKNGIKIDISIFEKNGNIIVDILNLIMLENYKKACTTLYQYLTEIEKLQPKPSEGTKLLLTLLIYSADMHCHQLRQNVEKLSCAIKPTKDPDIQTELLKSDLELTRPKIGLFNPNFQQPTKDELRYAHTIFANEPERFPNPDKIPIKAVRLIKLDAALQEECVSESISNLKESVGPEVRPLRIRKVKKSEIEQKNPQQNFLDNLARNPMLLKASIGAAVILNFGTIEQLDALLKKIAEEERIISLYAKGNKSALLEFCNPVNSATSPKSK